MNKQVKITEDEYYEIKEKIANNDYVSEEELNNIERYEKYNRNSFTTSFRYDQETSNKIDYIAEKLSITKGIKSAVLNQSIDALYTILKNKELGSDKESDDLSLIESIGKSNSKNILKIQYLLTTIIDFMNISSDKVNISSLIDLSKNPYENNSVDILKQINYQVDMDYKAFLTNKETKKRKRF